MNFTIENGQGIFHIGLSEIGSYIQFDYPLTVVWYDCNGSDAKYFCNLSENENYRKAIHQSINADLNQDYTDKTDELKTLLLPLFQLFQNGNYSLSFYNNQQKEFFLYHSSVDHFTTDRYSNLEILFSQQKVNVSNTDIVVEEHQTYLQKIANSSEHYPYSLLQFSTDTIYDDLNSFYATQPKDAIDQDQVRYFEQQIRAGERPFAIVFHTRLDSEMDDTPYFIVDGHHKLLAYKNLNITPPLAVITHLPQDRSEVEFNLETLNEHLYPWQMEHLLEHWEENEHHYELLKEVQQKMKMITKSQKNIKNPTVKHQSIWSILKNYLNPKP